MIPGPDDPPFLPSLALEVILLKLLPRSEWIDYELARDYMQSEVRGAIQRELMFENKAAWSYFNEVRAHRWGAFGVALDWLEGQGLVRIRIVGETPVYQVRVKSDEAVEAFLGRLSETSRKLYDAYSPSILIRMAGA